jgi:3-dehydrosphinganine reductase
MFLDDDTIELAQQQMNLNYFGSMKMAHVIGQMMAQRGRGRICFVGSACSWVTFPGFAGYSSSKYAVRALADSIQHELSQFGVSVHCYLPGTIETPGLKIENESKPKVTWAIEGNST